MQGLSLFFQDEAGQRGGFGPIGKIAHQNGEIFQRKCPQPGQHCLLFVCADDRPAVQDGAEHPAGPQGLEGSFQRRDAALCVGDEGVENQDIGIGDLTSQEQKANVESADKLTDLEREKSVKEDKTEITKEVLSANEVSQKAADAKNNKGEGK